MLARSACAFAASKLVLAECRSSSEALALVLKPHDVGLDRFAFGIILLQLTKEIRLLHATDPAT